ncbi:MAG: DnaD domain protein [Ruminococcus sp.]|nr:DnaD domain protein [Ruminococcus sp.]
MKYRVNFGFKAFAIPSVVVDNLIILANENHLKVLLYILRYPEENFTSKQIASKLRMNQEFVEEALEFWLKVNILQDGSQPEPVVKYAFDFALNNNNNNNNIQKNNPISEIKQQPIEEIKFKPSRNTSEELTRLSNQDIKEMIESSAELNDLIEKSKDYFRRDQNAVQIRSLIWMHDYLGFHNEVIFILLDYCSAINRLDVRNIDKIAFQWWEDEIFTEEEANRKVKHLKEFYTYTAYIKRLFEMDSNPTKNQKEIIARWQSVGYSEELLLFAHDVTVESIAKKNFKYIDKILQSWSDANVTTLEEAQKVRDEFVKKYEKTKDKKKGKSKNKKEKFTREEMEGYLSLVNRLEGD